MNIVDYNSVDSISHFSKTILDKSIVINYENFNETNELLKNQYINLNNLGSNLLDFIDTNEKILLLQEFLEYTNNNYLNILYFNDIDISSNRLIEIGEFVYRFLCIDCFNVLIPNYLSSISCYNIEQFDKYYYKLLNGHPSSFKTQFSKVISDVLNELTSLQNLDKNILNDTNYKELLQRYTVYLELVNFGDTSNFLENYFRRNLIKNIDDITWRLY